MAADHAEAGWAALSAAWASDDAGGTVAGVTYRQRAAEQFRRARTGGQTFAPDRSSENAILVDVLRRAGEFHDALDVLTDVPKTLTTTVESVLGFEAFLVRAGDRRKYSVTDARSWAEGSEDWRKGLEALAWPRWRGRARLWGGVTGLALLLFSPEALGTWIGLSLSSLVVTETVLFRKRRRRERLPD